MTENVENLILEHLRAIRAGMADLATVAEETKMRISSLEAHVAGLRRDVALVHDDIAVTHVRIDHVEQRVARIERRLEING